MSGWTPVTEDTLKSQPPAGWTPVEQQNVGAYQTRKAGPILNTGESKVHTFTRAFLSSLGVDVDKAEKDPSFMSSFTGALGDIGSGIGKAAKSSYQELTKATGEEKDKVGPFSALLTLPNMAARGIEGVATNIESGASDIESSIKSGDWKSAAYGLGSILGLKGQMEVAERLAKPSAPKAGAGLAEHMYQSALKPSTALPTEQVANIVKTGLQNEIPVSESGVQKVGALIDDLNQKIAGKIQAGAGQGVTVNKFAVASRLGNTFSDVSSQVNPEKAQAAVARAGNEFLRNQPAEIPAEQAQALKQGTYKQIGKSYGQLSSATIESQKALARGIKEELASQIPEIGDLNAKESQLIGLDKALERAVRRIGNQQLVGIGTPIVAGGVGVITRTSWLGAVAGIVKAVIDDPIVKSKLAIAMSRKGGGMTSAYSRLGAYSAALANARPGGGPTPEQGNEQ